MKSLRLVGIAAVGVLGASASATYTFTGSNYSFTRPFTTCTAGPCANFTTSMRVGGSFTTASPLAPNLSLQSIASLVVAYSFSDGLSTYTSSDPNARIVGFDVATDATGQISNAALTLELWQTGSSPHQAGDRFAVLAILNSPNVSAGADNAPCSAVGTSPSGAADSCTSVITDAATSIANATPGGTWSIALSVPALGKGGTIALAVLLMAAAWLQAGRKRRTPRNL